MEIPTFKSKKELYDFLVTNKETLIAQKKAEMKRADGFSFVVMDDIQRVRKEVSEDATQLHVKAIINTTNYLDSHVDVHLPGLWNKSLKENKSLLHLQEHEMKFASIIADGDDLKAYTKTFTWKELGYNYPGSTEALVFDSTVKQDRNAFMFSQYKKGRVTNHSVGMQYVKLMLAINDEDYPTEKEIWDKYYKEIANKEMADQSGYFWAVKEAKAIEGSAVPIGSNRATPTHEVKEPSKDTHEPSKDTLTSEQMIEIIKKF